MPNWITNKITAPPHVIHALLDDTGGVDFNRVIAFPGLHHWDAISCAAEDAAKRACGATVDVRPVLAALQTNNRAQVDLRTLSGDAFDQFVGMLQNFRACGYLHSMEFARDKWGTKWNACDSSADVAAGRCHFDTAWACPEPIFVTLSARFPDDAIRVVFADEDIGSNCGVLVFKNGAIAETDVAPDWRDLDEAARTKWRAFAYDVKGWTPDEDGD